MKRRVLRAVLSGLGVTSLRWRTLENGLYCFNYHRIGNPAATAFDREIFSCSRDHFREHVALLRDRFKVINLEELRSRGGHPPSGKPLALITFDDGYVDNYTTAFPVLKEFGATAVFFIPTGFAGSSFIPWWDEIAWTLRNATAETIRLGGSDAEFSLRDGSIERTISAVLYLVKHRPQMRMSEQVAEIRAACKPARSVEEAGEPLFMDWDQIREMHRAGMDVGSHTRSHEILSHLSPDRQADELRSSKATLEFELGSEVLSVSYPVGMRSSYTAETCRIAQEVGYTFGFNFVKGMTRLPLENPFDLNRFAVDGDRGSVPAFKALACHQWL